ncbi:hypothetical protein IKG13_00815 [Candidatus Saccharibacteria bacterium]|nr:hypothetical protein [Candidatus Saccharibacteria bacterium]MBR3377939.1 hypothetical protein [Candidatus Saccharibacteria bacterium]
MKFVYLVVYLGFNLFFGIFFVIGLRGLIKMISFKKRKKYFTVSGEAKYVSRTKTRNKLSGWEYEYTYKVKVRNTTVEAKIESIANEKVGLECPMGKQWTPVMVNPENYSEIRLPSEDNAIAYYKKLAIILLAYGLVCRLIFGFFIWNAFLEEGGLK